MWGVHVFQHPQPKYIPPGPQTCTYAEQEKSNDKKSISRAYINIFCQFYCLAKNNNFSSKGWISLSHEHEIHCRMWLLKSQTKRPGCNSLIVWSISFHCILTSAGHMEAPIHDQSIGARNLKKLFPQIKKHKIIFVTIFFYNYSLKQVLRVGGQLQKCTKKIAR